MGLRVEILRGTYDSDLNVFRGKAHVTVVNLPGPFEPTAEAPAAVLVRRGRLGPVITPELPVPNTAGPMMGGTYAATSDSRFSEAIGFYGAIPIHDRFESWELNRSMSL